MAALSLAAGEAANGVPPVDKRAHHFNLVVAEFADCVAKVHHDKAKELVLREYGSPYDESFERLEDGWCAARAESGISIRFPNYSFPQVLAISLIKIDFPQKGPESFADRAPLPHYPLPDAKKFEAWLKEFVVPERHAAWRAEFDRQNAIAHLSRVGECIARSNPEAVRGWVIGPPDNDAAVIDKAGLRPAIQQCLSTVPAEKFADDELRRGAARNYYRLAYSTAQDGRGAVH